MPVHAPHPQNSELTPKGLQRDKKVIGKGRMETETDQSL
jgi:hypothetical protein